MSLFVCAVHGLHHGPFCCDAPQQWWDGTFVSETASGMEAGTGETEGLDPKDDSPTAESGDAQ